MDGCRKMPSIREMKRDAESAPPKTTPLPDFCNLGIWLRVILAANAAALAAALIRHDRIEALPIGFIELAAVVEPALMASLLMLCAGRRWLERLPLSTARIAIVAVAAACAVAAAALFIPIPGAARLSWRPAFWGGAAAMLLLAWFELAARARAPALTEARLMALTARIRPHFLFNSLNAVLGVIRTDPKRAEAALEELSDLFRALMRENRELTPLSEEIALARQYLGLERLRLGERLRVRWDVETCPPDAFVPPLMLQPLIENAVYHGIEPLDGGGEVAIRVAREGDRILFEISNPYSAEGGHPAGNQMALENIRERLLLFFDLEGGLDVNAGPSHYVVRISFPYRKEGGR